MTKLERITAEPKENAEAAVIWLHGLGASGYDFSPIVPTLNLPHQDRIRFIFPHAPNIPVSINGGMVMPAWFDIQSLDFSGTIDSTGILQASQSLSDLIEEQKQVGIPSNKICLAGFSQGGTVALHCGLCFPEKLAGIIGLSTFLPNSHDLLTQTHPSNEKTPIFLAHGSEDPMVEPQFAEISRDFLKKSGYPVSWYSYPMGHKICPAEIDALGAWITQVIDLKS